MQINKTSVDVRESWCILTDSDPQSLHIVVRTWQVGARECCEDVCMRCLCCQVSFRAGAGFNLFATGSLALRDCHCQTVTGCGTDMTDTSWQTGTAALACTADSDTADSDTCVTQSALAPNQSISILG